MRLRQVVGGLAGAAAMIALVNVASRVVGFVRWLTNASEVGPTSLGDAYNSANTLPNVLFEVVAGGALASVVVPLLAAPIAAAVRKDVDRIASAFLGWTLAVLVPLAVVVAVAARPIVWLVMRGESDAEITVAAWLLAMFALQIPLYGLGLVLTGVLQAHRRFFWPAFAPLLNSLVVISAFLVFGRMVADPAVDPASISAGALAVLGWGTTAGVAVMSLPLLVPVRRLGVRLRPTLRFPEGVAARARSLALAGLGALVAQQASVLVTMALANRYGPDGTWPVYQYTQAVYVLPYAVLAFPLATATLPRLAERAAIKDDAGFARLGAATTRLVLGVSALGAGVLVAIAPAVQTVFEHVTPAGTDVEGMAVGLSWMAPGLLGFALVLHVSRALYALHRGRAAATATAAGWLVAAVGAAVAVLALTDGDRDRVGALLGLGLASTVGMLVAGAALLAALVRSAGRDTVAGVPRTLVVTVGAAALGAAAGRVLTDAFAGAGWVTALVAGVGGAVLCGVVVLGATWLADRTLLSAVREPRATGEPVPGSAPTVG